jgi:hypothetical protein
MLGKPADQLAGETAGEIVMGRVAGAVLEGQHRDGGDGLADRR